jgi:hypothetical protein
MYESHRVNGGIAQIRFRLIGVELNVLSISLTFPPVNYYLGSYRDSLSPKGCGRSPLPARGSNTNRRGSNSPFNLARTGNKDNQMATKITVNRSAVTGKFVTPQYAAKHPRTTETEHYKKPK